MECPNGCGSAMEEVKRDKILCSLAKPVVVSNLNIYICPECGQETIPLSSAKIIENVLNGTLKPSGIFTADLYEVNSLV